MKNYNVCLTVAGSDPSGGAGVQADLKVFAFLKCYGAAAISALTVQNSLGVRRVEPVPPDVVAEQMAAVLDDLPVRAVKIGMLATQANVRAVAKVLSARRGLFVVLDPVDESSSGQALSRGSLWDTMEQELFPHVDLLTPNRHETLAMLRHRPEEEFATTDEAAAALHARFPQSAILAKGGHLPGDPVDTLITKEGRMVSFPGTRVPTRNTHGTGCALSSAIAAFVARGLSLPEAVKQAKTYVAAALAKGAEYYAGAGAGSMCHDLSL